MEGEGTASTQEETQTEETNAGATQESTAPPEVKSPPSPGPLRYPITTQEQYDREIGKIVARERARAQHLEEKSRKYDEVVESRKSELEKAAERIVGAEKDRDSAKLEALRLRVAASKGLTERQAERLRGSNKEELEADADELLDEFATSDDGKGGKGPKRQPKENLRGGSDPTEETGETDPKRLADQVPRGW